MTDRPKEAGASDYKAAPDAHVDENGERVPTPDPKDQTGDPDADNPAMRELRKRQGQGDITES
jgi:hypothetical protein